MTASATSSARYYVHSAKRNAKHNAESVVVYRHDSHGRISVAGTVSPDGSFRAGNPSRATMVSACCLGLGGVQGVLALMIREEFRKMFPVSPIFAR